MSVPCLPPPILLIAGVKPFSSRTSVHRSRIGLSFFSGDCFCAILAKGYGVYSPPDDGLVTFVPADGFSSFNRRQVLYRGRYVRIAFFFARIFDVSIFHLICLTPAYTVSFLELSPLWLLFCLLTLVIWRKLFFVVPVFPHCWLGSASSYSFTILFESNQLVRICNSCYACSCLRGRIKSGCTQPFRWFYVRSSLAFRMIPADVHSLITFVAWFPPKLYFFFLSVWVVLDGAFPAHCFLHSKVLTADLFKLMCLRHARLYLPSLFFLEVPPWCVFLPRYI